MLKINSGNFEQSLDLQRELGKGAFGSVYLAYDDRGKPFAVKISNCMDINSNIIATQEIGILIDLKHENIARMHAFDFHGKQAVLIMEYCDGGNLNSRLSNLISDNTKDEWIFQLLKAVQYLHNNKIVHRDLKPENVLLNGKDKIKVTDFGISRFYFKNAAFDDNLSEYVEAYMGTFAGTPYWIAPEVFDRKYTETADIFSLGVLFHAILTGEFIELENCKYYGAFAQHYRAKVGIGMAMYEKGKTVLPESQPLLNKKHKNLMENVVFKMLRYKAEDRISLKDALVQLKSIKQSDESPTNRFVQSNIEIKSQSENENYILKRKFSEGSSGDVVKRSQNSVKHKQKFGYQEKCFSHLERHEENQQADGSFDKILAFLRKSVDITGLFVFVVAVIVIFWFTVVRAIVSSFHDR